MDELKRQYNELLKRFYKAEMYLENPAVSLEEREKQIPRLQDVITGLNKLLVEIGTHTQHEALNGFYYNYTTEE